MRENNGSWIVPGTLIEVMIVPFMPLGYKIHTIRLEETIGGNLGTGHISLEVSNDLLQLTKDMDALYKWNNVLIKICDKKTDTQYDIYGWIYKKSTLMDFIDLDFYTFPYKEQDPLHNREFFTCPVISSYDTGEDPGKLKDIIQLLWGGDIEFDIRCDSDLGSVPKYLWLMNETNYLFLTKLLSSYCLNSIFGYGLQGGFIKKLLDKDNKEPKHVVVGSGNTTQASSHIRTVEYLLHQKILDPWKESDIKSKNIEVNTLNGKYYMAHPGALPMMNNYKHNKKILLTAFFSSLDIKTTLTLPLFKLGDCIIYKNLDDGYQNKESMFIVSANSIFIAAPDVADTDETGNKFSVLSVLRGIEENQSQQFPSEKYPDLEETDQLGGGIVN